MNKVSRRIAGEMLILENAQTGESLRIHETVEDGVGRIAPDGELTAEMANDLEDELTSLTLLCEEIVIDMKGVSFISNSAIKKILEVQHAVDARDGTLLITGVGASIYKVFEEMGLESVFDIERIDRPVIEERTSDEM